ncbi:MAG: alpha/beta fold hydrolase [Candidatus Binataceae bacterium]
MPFAQLNGAELYYETHGEGPALVFAHGGFGNHLSWWQQLAEFSRSFKCVTFDHRGFGWSREPADSPGPHAFAEDLRALLDHLEIRRAALVGQSMGGWTVLGFASAYPERTRALVLYDTMAGVDASDLRLPTASASRQRPADRAAVFRQAVARDFPQRAPAMNFLYHQVAALNVNLAPESLRKLLKVRNRVEPVVERRIPTLIFAGEMDEMTPPPVMEALARQFPHGRLVKVAGAGHSVYWEKPAEFNALLKQFLDATPA